MTRIKAAKLNISKDEANKSFLRNLKGTPSLPTIQAVQKIKDNWYENNEIKSLLEVGCMDGKNGHAIKKLVGEYTGVDPSPMAVERGISNGLNLKIGWAHSLNLDKQFDVIVLGFFLYLTSPEHWFLISKNIYEHLKTDSFIIINDFYSEVHQQKKYSHDHSMKINKYNFNKLFTWHPAISLVNEEVRSENIREHKDIDKWYRTSILKVSKCG